MVVRAVLEKLATADGLVRFAHAQVGQEYLCHLESITRGQTLIHGKDDNGGPPIVHEKDIIWTVDGVWLPLECLRLEEGSA